MKYFLRYIAMLCLCFPFVNIYAQAFEKNNILVSVGIGAIDDVTATSNGESMLAVPKKFTFYPARPQFMVKTEFAVHRYWGVGFIASVDGRMNMPYNSTPAYPDKVSEANTQLGLLVNYHFYQLIADKLNRNPKLHADKWDIYTGFTIGANVNLSSVNGYGSRPQFSPFMGLHLGVRYYINEHISVFGEIGVGQSWSNIGITYKFGAPKKMKQPKDF